MSFLIVSLYSSSAYAHRVYFFGYADGGKVYTEGYFVDGRKAINSKVEVHDKKNGEILLTGKTDRNGQFSFVPPRKADLRVTIDAGMGHKAEYIITAKELGKISQAPKSVSSSVPSEVKEESSESTPKEVELSMSAEELKKIIDASLEEKLRPILMEIAKSENKASPVKNAIAGMGYIFGLMGLAMYFKKK